MEVISLDLLKLLIEHSTYDELSEVRTWLYQSLYSRFHTKPDDPSLLPILQLLPLVLNASITTVSTSSKAATSQQPTSIASLLPQALLTSSTEISHAILHLALLESPLSVLLSLTQAILNMPDRKVAQSELISHLPEQCASLFTSFQQQRRERQQSSLSSPSITINPRSNREVCTETCIEVAKRVITEGCSLDDNVISLIVGLLSFSCQINKLCMYSHFISSFTSSTTGSCQLLL